MPVQNANVIDLLALDTATDEVVLSMAEPRPWDGSDQRIYQLQEKVNAYLSFALDGEMLQQLPQLTGKKIRLQLDCLDEPDPKTAHFIEVIQQQIGFQDIQFGVSIVPDLENTAIEECCGGGGGGCCGGQGGGHGHSHEHSEAQSGCCGGNGGDHGHSHAHSHEHAHEHSGCCGGNSEEHSHTHEPVVESQSSCCGGNGGCGCS